MALSRYVPRFALTLLAQGPIPESGRFADTEAAVLFVDISGFTALVDLITTRFGDEGAERLQGLLNACFTPLVETVDRAGGQVLAFPGDAALCLWPLRETGTLQHAVLRAAQCAIHLRQQLDGLSSVAGVQLRIRSAVTAGAIQASLVGGVDGRWHVVVRGPAIEQLGAAIGAAAPGDILLSAETRQVCRQFAQGTERGQHWLLGGVTPSAVEQAALPEPFAWPDDGEIAGLVPASVRARVDAGQQGWMSEFRVVTVLFIVIKQAPADHAESQQAVHLIQASIQRFDGELNQVVFDDKGLTAVAVFGLFQQSHENDGSRAVGAARELREALQAAAVDPRMGIATGRVFTGVRGGASREEFAVMGPVVVLAARLAGVADDILCDSVTQASAKASFHFDQAPPKSLKGMGLVSDLGRPSGALTGNDEAVDARRSTETIGRAAERARIEWRLAALAEHAAGAVMVIAGEPGIGKSVLIAATRGSAEHRGIKCLLGAGDPIQPLTTLRAWRSIFTALLVGDQPGDALLIVDRLTALLGNQEADWFPLLNPVLPIHLPETDRTSRLTAESRARTTRSLLVSLLQGFAAQGRLLVTIEDAHWIDSSSWDLIDEVIVRVPGVLLILTTRLTQDSDPHLAKLMESQQVDVISLAPMVASEISELVAARVGANRLSDDLARWIQQRCEGNPLFASEIALMLIEEGSAAVRDGTCVLVDDGPARSLASLPDTVRGVIAVRIDRLRAEDQLTLKVAAVLGRQVDFEALRAISPLSEPRDELMTRVMRVVTTGLMSPPTGRALAFEFSHALVQEVAYDLLTFAQRRTLHQRAAENFEQQNDAASAALAPLLAHHWERAEVAAKAMLYLEQAGVHALLHASSNPEAEQFFTRLIRLGDAQAGTDTKPAPPGSPSNVGRAKWERMLAQAIARQGRHTTALSHLARGLSLLGRSMPAGGWKGRAEALSRIAIRLAVAPPARARAGSAAVQDPAGLEAARLYDNLARMLYQGEAAGRGGDSEAALLSSIAVLRAGTLSERIGPSGELSCAYSMLANLIAILRRPRMALQYAEWAREVAEEADDQQALFRALTVGQLPAFTFGRWQEAEGWLSDGQILGARLKNLHDSLVSGCTLAYISFHRDQLGEAFARFDDICCQARDSGNVLPQLWAMVGMSEVHLREERLADAIETAEACLRLANDRKVTDQNSRFQAHGVIASARSRQDEREQAMAEVEPAMSAAAAGGQLSFSAQAGFVGVAEALFAACDAGGPDVRTTEARLQRWLWRMRAAAFCRPILEPASLHFRAAWNQRRGRPGAARRQLLKSIRLAESLAMPYEARLGRQALANLPSRRIDKLNEPPHR